MNVGMLWFDNDPRTTLAAKVAKAADYYRQKYGLVPDLCLVNPSMLLAQEQRCEQIVVRPSRSILPGHLWVGIEEKQQ